MRQAGFYWVKMTSERWLVCQFVVYGEEKYMQHWEVPGIDDNMWRDEDFIQIDETRIINPHE